MWRLIYDVLRFNANAQKLLIDMESQGGPDKELSIGSYLKQNGYSDSFRDNYLIVCGLSTLSHLAADLGCV